MTMANGHDIASAAGYGDPGIPRSRLILGFAVLASLAIHGSGLLLLPGKSDLGVANFGQGGITVSLGPAGRVAGGEVAQSESASEAVEDLETAKTEAIVSESAELESAEPEAAEPESVEPELAALSEADATLETEPEISPIEDAPEAIEDIVPEPEPPYEILRDTVAPEAALTEAEPEAEAAEVAVETIPITQEANTQEANTQEASIALTAKAVPPPLPKRRPEVTKPQTATRVKPRTQTASTHEAAVQKAAAEQTAAKKPVKKKPASPADAIGEDRAKSTEGESETQTDHEFVGQGGRSGQSGLSEAGQGDNTAGGGASGAASDYYREVQTWLEKHKRYPRRSKLRSEEGVVMLRFIVNRAGIVTLSDIKKGSGHKRLDKEAMGMIERAQPLPAMPEDMRQANLEIVVPVRFYLQ